MSALFFPAWEDLLELCNQLSGNNVFLHVFAASPHPASCLFFLLSFEMLFICSPHVQPGQRDATTCEKGPESLPLPSRVPRAELAVNPPESVQGGNLLSTSVRH